MKLRPMPSRVLPDGRILGARIRGYPEDPGTAAFLARVEAEVRPGLRVADIGGGTGILALRAAELGAQVDCYEIEPAWRAEIAANAAENQLAVRVLDAFPAAWDGTPYDLVVANLGAIEPELEALIRSAGNVVMVSRAD